MERRPCSDMKRPRCALAVCCALFALVVCTQAAAAGPAAAGPSDKDPAAHRPVRMAIPSLFPANAVHIAMCVVVAIVLAIAAGGGQGGGPVIVPLFLLCGFSNTTAVALSNASIFAGAVASVLMVVPCRRHPFKDRPLVAWDVILLLQPPTAIGAMWGAHINKLIPGWIAQVLLAVILVLLAWRMSNRALFIYRREAAMHKAAAGAGEGEGEPGQSEQTGKACVVEAAANVRADAAQPRSQQQQQDGSKTGSSTACARCGAACLCGATGSDGAGDAEWADVEVATNLWESSPRHRSLETQMVQQRHRGSSGSDDNTAAGAGEQPSQSVHGAEKTVSGPVVEGALSPHVALARVLKSESAQLPPAHIAALVALCGTVLAASLISKHQPCGSPGFWGAQAAAVPVLLALSLVARWDVLRKGRIKSAAQVDWAGEIRWTRSNSLVFPVVSVLAGILAGVFGLGGGVVFGPIMLELGAHPQVTAATTQTLLFFTTGASTAVFAQMGDIPWGWGGLLMGIAFVSTLVGQAAIDKAVRHMGRSSLVVIVLAAFFGIAALLSIYAAGRAVAAYVHDPSLIHPPGIC